MDRRARMQRTCRREGVDCAGGFEDREASRRPDGSMRLRRIVSIAGKKEWKAAFRDRSAVARPDEERLRRLSHNGVNVK
jgi:hypothetical protein